MTELIRRINPNSTILVIDFPIMLLIQMYYYYPIRRDNINLMNRTNNSIIQGQINLCPINIVQNLNFNPFALFIATWSLSAGSHAVNDSIANELNFFNATNILYGYRNYEKFNPRQPLSKKLQLNRDIEKYSIVYDDICFFTLANENNYYFAQKM